MSGTTALKRYGCLGVLLLLPLTRAAAQQSANGTQGILYFVAATATWNRTDSFPAILYHAENGKLILDKEIVSPQEGVQFVRHFDGVLTIGSPHVLPTTLHLVDVRSGKPEISSIPLKFDGTQITTTLILEPPKIGLAQGFELMSSVNGSLARTSNVIQLSSPLNAVTLKKDVPSSVWSFLRITGSTGGPLDQGDRANCTIRNGRVAFPSTSGLIQLGPQLTQGRSVKEEYCTIVGSNQRWIVFIKLFKSFEELAAAKQKTFEVYDRSLQRTTLITVQGSFSRVSLFGNWLVTATVEPNFTHRHNPEMRKSQPAKAAPSINELFESNEPPEYFPGICVLHNLQNGEIVTVDTGAADTEILGVTGDLVIYRVNDQIIQGKIGHSSLTEPITLAQDADVPAIHWMLTN